MTKEEAREAIKFGHCDDIYYRKEYEEAVNMAIKALEQQPCEDCVKREDVQDIMARLLSDYLHDEDREKIENANAEIGELPSVQPQPKRGKWKVIRKEYEFMGGIVNEAQGCKCSNCGGIVRFKSDFCPNCGCYCGGDDNVDE